MEKTEKVLDFDKWEATGFGETFPTSKVVVKSPKLFSKYLGDRVLWVGKTKLLIWSSLYHKIHRVEW